MPTVRNKDWKAVVYPTLSGVLVLAMIGIVTWGQSASRRLTSVEIRADELAKVTSNCLEEIKANLAGLHVYLGDRIDRVNTRISDNGERLSRIEGRLNGEWAKDTKRE